MTSISFCRSGYKHLFVLVAIFYTVSFTVEVVESKSISSSLGFVPRSSLSEVQTSTNANAIQPTQCPLEKKSPYTKLNNQPLTQTRGGSLLSPAQISEFGGAFIFVLLDHIFRITFKQYGVSFPSQLGGCCILFLLLVLAEFVRPGVGDGVFLALAPGAGLLAKWLPVFFVPGLAMLPLAPSMGSSFEVIKVLAVVVLGFFYSAFTTSFCVLALRKMQGQGSSNAPPTVPSQTAGSATQGPPSKPYSDEFLSSLVKGLVLTGALSIGATKGESTESLVTPLRTLFMACATVTGYVWGALLPSSFTKVVHPLVTSTVVTLLMTQITGLATGTSFDDVLRTYKSGTLNPLTSGAGDILLYLLGPSVVSFAIAMYSRTQVMMDNLAVVVTAVFVASAGGLFGTAAFVRLLNVGGEAGRILRLSLLPRNVTTPLAIAITNILGGDISFASAVVVLTGIFGATFGGRVMTRAGIHDPVSRGLGIGAAAQGLGVASISGEREAFPFAAISMVLTAVAATVLVSIPAVKDALIAICD